MELPEIIEYKQFKEQLTKEQQIFDKTHSKQSIDEGEEKILDELINFYSKTTAELEKIDLKNITKDGFDKLNDFLKQFYNVLYPVQNKLDFQKFSRHIVIPIPAFARNQISKFTDTFLHYTYWVSDCLFEILS